MYEYTFEGIKIMKETNDIVATKKIKIYCEDVSFYNQLNDYRHKCFIYHNKLMSNLYSAHSKTMEDLNKLPLLSELRTQLDDIETSIYELSDNSDKPKLKDLNKQSNKLTREYKTMYSSEYDSVLKEHLNIGYKNGKRKSIANYAYTLADDLMGDVSSYIRAGMSNLAYKSFMASKKNGLFKGQHSLRTAKLKSMNVPFMKPNDHTITLEDNEYICNLGKWCNKFKLITGFKKGGHFVKDILDNIIAEEYQMCDSYFKKNDNYWYLYLVFKKPVEHHTLNTDKVMGIDLGITRPISYAIQDINTDKVYTNFIGDKSRIANTIKLFQNKRRDAQSSCVLAKSGKGRTRKLKYVDNLKNKQSAYFNNFNHVLAKQTIEVAKQNKCKYINVEDLSNIGKDQSNNMVLRNWKYADLIDKLSYKASKHGIIVRKINPAYTSQRCSKCDTVSKDNRLSQESFKCVSCGFSENADINASINILRSDDFC